MPSKLHRLRALSCSPLGAKLHTILWQAWFVECLQSSACKPVNFWYDGLPFNIYVACPPCGNQFQCRVSYSRKASIIIRKRATPRHIVGPQLAQSTRNKKVSIQVLAGKKRTDPETIRACQAYWDWPSAIYTLHCLNTTTFAYKRPDVFQEYRTHLNIVKSVSFWQPW